MCTVVFQFPIVQHFQKIYFLAQKLINWINKRLKQEMYWRRFLINLHVVLLNLLEMQLSHQAITSLACWGETTLKWNEVVRSGERSRQHMLRLVFNTFYVDIKVDVTWLFPYRLHTVYKLLYYNIILNAESSCGNWWMVSWWDTVCSLYGV